MSMSFGSFVVPTRLAESTDLTNWTGDAAPSNADAILRSCTTLVLEAVQGVICDVDPSTGLATDPVIAGALRDATCIQAAAWIALGIDPATGGIVQASKNARSKGIGSARIEYSDAEVQAVAAARAAAYSGLVPEATSYLQQRNLLGTNIWTLG
ncbi:MAG: hypothetical protein J0I33_07750 [Microbacterium ginsengisoli]|jgi:hypothetical protein|nr:MULTISPECIES: hypothetical protein [unclassified Microbacterium]KQR97691.1 hypothetical protein ASF93_13260 [Microbacterium sp. Leaf347]KQS01715.1 hypothetical protein ASG00_09775 [Microbacterium sp. Leaf351]MBN9198517.1 hypothetical protein [Microbacterium ginsengisoli]OJU78098.1 MAG: hypothetical protein BGO15_02540 [Microbacterium sp. 71-23]